MLNLNKRGINMRLKNKFKIVCLFSLATLMTTNFAHADWAVAPDLQSKMFWQLVSEGKAEVVSSVGFGGDPSKRHEKHTVFKILDLGKYKDKKMWLVNSEGGFRPVMCTEVWADSYTYRGSSCEIPGCLFQDKKCMSEDKVLSKFIK